MKLTVRHFQLLAGGYAALWLIAQPVCAYLALVPKIIDISIFYRGFLPASFLMILMGWTYIAHFNDRININWTISFLVLALWMAAVIAAHATFGSHIFDSEGVSIDYFNARVVFYSVAQFFCALILTSSPMQRFGLALGLSVLSIFVLAASPEDWRVDYGELTQVQASAVYLMLGDSVALVSLALLGVMSGGARYAVVLATAACLVLVQSRTSLYLFSAVAALELLRSVERKWLRIFLSLVVGCSGAMLIWLMAGSDDRMLAISNLGADSSFNSRMIQFEVGLNQIFSHPLTGEYEGVAREFGGFGQYMHGLPSYWQGFGLVPFLLAVAVVIAALAKYLASEVSRDIRMVMVYAVGCALLSRAYIFPFVPVLAALLATKRRTVVK